MDGVLTFTVLYSFSEVFTQKSIQCSIVNSPWGILRYCRLSRGYYTSRRNLFVDYLGMVCEGSKGAIMMGNLSRAGSKTVYSEQI